MCFRLVPSYLWALASGVGSQMLTPPQKLRGLLWQGEVLYVVTSSNGSMNCTATEPVHVPFGLCMTA